jgi:two-component system, OmpR family, response regulator VicR
VKILVCEDDKITLKALEYTLKREGYEVFTAADGKAGAEILRDDSVGIDFMITDQHMPYFSGLELVYLVRSELKQDIPIIMLTRVNQDETRNLALSLGVNEYMTKPFIPNQLLMRIQEIMMNHTSV